VNANSTLADIAENVDSRLLCVRCGNVLSDYAVVLTQLPTKRGCVGVVMSFLCKPCVIEQPSAAHDVVSLFAGIDVNSPVITDSNAWRRR